ncbi:FecR family protein [Almyronema epifaneia]|uniref:FecR domain-containing protein n=1 Tax=Almyronema epifaneia S1 TaxID=2991925 RepID=A0ABW6IKI3_9CYAN
MRRWTQPLLIAAAVGITCSASTSIIAQTLPVRVNRWLELRQTSGSVVYVRGSRTQPARTGFRLQAVGDGLRTGARARATLALDTQIGFVQVSENTDLQITELRTTRNGGRVTEITVNRGQARLQARPFTVPDTELNIRTPAGVSGVRGTIFGVSVQPGGRTGVATEEGNVETSAQGQSVNVPAGFQSMIVPGEPPTPPMPLTNDPSLNLSILRAVDDTTVEIIGRVDPLNLLLIEDAVQTLDRSGEFNLRLPLPADRRIQALVTTPLGQQQAYELVVP